MQESCGNKSLAHALAVTGLGGTGKTQIVLHYVERFGSRYDTILWIDVLDEATARSSYERCCDALSISLELKSSPTRLQDAAAVQELHQWLAKRDKDQKWLVIFDNADNLADLNLVIPSNKSAGSVIITSQDASVIRLLPRAKTVTVDKMEIGEAKALLIECMDLKYPEAHGKLPPLLEELSNSLDRIVLAVDLAGARIRNDMDSRHDMHTIDADDAAVHAIERYLLDLDEHRRSILSDPGFNDIGPYKKTIWTVWETVLASLEQSEQSDADACAYPLQLLKLAALLGPKIIHRELFRSASQSLHNVCAGLKYGTEPPQWFKCLLKLAGDRTWDAFAYNRSVDRLARFHLVRQTSNGEAYLSVSMEAPVTIPWPGFAMHGLVQWRARTETTEAEYGLCQIILVAACSRANNEWVDGLNFRRALWSYLPQLGHVWQLQDWTVKGFADICSTLGITFSSIQESYMAEHVLLFAYILRRKMFGRFASATIETGMELRDASHAEKYKAIIDELQDVYMIAERYGAGQSLTDAMYEFLARITTKATSLDTMMPMVIASMCQYMEAHCFSMNARAGDVDRKDALIAVRRQAEEKIASQASVLDIVTEKLGMDHCVVMELRLSFANMVSSFLGHDEAKTHLEDLLISVKQRYGHKHCGALQIMQRLANCQTSTNEVFHLSRQVLGDDDPRTRRRGLLVKLLREQEARISVSPQEQKSDSRDMAFVNDMMSSSDLPSDIMEILESDCPTKIHRARIQGFLGNYRDH